jgi:hypothetical protein
MATVISSALVLTQQEDKSNSGRLCWINYANAGNVTATSAAAGFPITNLANPSTAFLWQAGSTAQQDIDISFSQEVDYIGFARHNLELSAEIRIQVKVGSSYITIVDWRLVPITQAPLFIFNRATPDGLRLSIRNNSVAPRIAVLYAGLSTILQRDIYVGHTPITYGRGVETVGGYSESGQYLGEIVRRESRTTQVALKNLTPLWYRETLDPFFAQRPRRPAFWAWRPSTYPQETAFAWLNGSPRPVNARSNGMMSVTFDLEGIA